MKSKSMFAMMVAAGFTLGLAGAGVFAEETAPAAEAVPAADKTAPATTPATTQSAKAINKMCPVMPEDEVTKKYFVMYKGDKIGLCCKDCIKDFNEDPEKYAKIAKAEKAEKK